MSLAKLFNSFLQIIYRLFAGIIMLIVAIVTISIIIGIAFSIIEPDLTFVVCCVFVLIIFLYIRRYKDHISEKKKSSSSFLFSEIIRLTLISTFFIVFIVYFYNPNFGNENFVLKDETVKLYTDSTKTKYNHYYKSIQTWKDFNNKRHTLPFKINYENVINSATNRNNYRIKYNFSWGSFYEYLIKYDKPLVEELSSAFYNYQKENKMSRKAFAELIITAIQDIPYTLISNKPCKVNDIKPCVSNVKLGIYAPAEFLSHLKGDCDTRTVLLYTLLSRFNYDVAILNSIEYRHSVLGLHITSTGKYKSYQNKKYYFVETTARGCPIGYLSQQFRNVDFWDFELINHSKS